MLIPGFLISIVTFPGVIVHELSHQLFCFFMRVPVYEVEYFQMDNPCGYVRHEPTDSPWANLLVCMGPFFINTLIGICIVLPTSIQMVEFGTLGAIFDGSISFAALLRYLPSILTYWLGISILMHAFPSMGDAKLMASAILGSKDVNIIVKIILAPFIGLAYVGAVGSIVWLDLAYAVLISISLPKLLALYL